MRASLLALFLLAGSALGFTPHEQPLGGVSAAQVTVYSATWCSACHSLEAALKDKGIPFDTVDVDQNPGAYAIAKKAAGASVIPLTNVLRGPSQRWIVGADAEAVARAYDGTD